MTREGLGRRAVPELHTMTIQHSTICPRQAGRPHASATIIVYG